MAAADPLATLVNLAQDFPIHAHNLVTGWQPTINATIDAELRVNRMERLQGGTNLIRLNGLQVPDNDLNMFRYALACTFHES